MGPCCMKIVTTSQEFLEIVSKWNGPIACDTETRGQVWDKEKWLIGVSFSCEKEDIYIPINHFENGTLSYQIERDLIHELKLFLGYNKIIGHNFTYDKRWLKEFGFDTEWIADTRIMWHMASAPSGPRPYSLKDAMKEILGWEETNEKELEENVESKGGLLKNGDHYLADMLVLAKYATKDSRATLELYSKFYDFFDRHSYWGILGDIMTYNQLLEENTYRGVKVDERGLLWANKRLLGGKEAALKRLKKDLKEPIASLEQDWADRKIANYKREWNKQYYANYPEKWERFNWNSDSHKRELFYGKLGNIPTYQTKGGRPATDSDTVKTFKGEWVSTYLKYEKSNTLNSSFVEPYIKSTSNSRLHPGFNICGTVSYRLSGFKPYLLNAPFDERLVMKNFVCDEGFVGIHADLSAIEPAITAHYSEDPALLKVFRDGLGDIYLDLALELFPNNKELKDGYNPRIPIQSGVKERFWKERKVSKIIHLAVQYTGTGRTVAKNLSREGISTTVEQANNYVRAYWRKFKAVDKFNRKLREVNRDKGLLRNVIGRIIRVPDPEYKDLSNRFIQSSAHDCLINWVLRIDELRKERQIEMYPVLIDCHDSTSWQVRSDYVKEGEEIFKEALKEVNESLGLLVTIKAEMKRFKTMAGLKNNE